MLCERLRCEETYQHFRDKSVLCEEMNSNPFKQSCMTDHELPETFTAQKGLKANVHILLPLMDM